MITNEDLAKLLEYLEKVKNEITSIQQRKTTTDIFGIINNLGDRLASHYTFNGFSAFYRLPNTGGQIIKISVDMDAEKEYNNLPDWYLKSDVQNEDLIHKIDNQKEE